MSDSLIVKVSTPEKAVWKKAARSVGEDLSEFTRQAHIRRDLQRVNITAQVGTPRRGVPT